MEAVFCVQGRAQPVGFVFLKHNNKLAPSLLQLCPLPTEHSGAHREWERFSMQWESGLGELAGVQGPRSHCDY